MLVNAAQTPARSGVLAVAVLTVVALLAVSSADAGTLELVPRLSVGEEYNDNIMFTKNHIVDYVTSVTPVIELQYDRPSLSASLSGNTSAEIFARGTREDNLARTQAAHISAAYEASERLSLSVSDGVSRVGATRIGPQPGATSYSSRTAGDPTPADTASTILPRGDVFSNYFTAHAKYALAPRWFSTASFSNGYNNFNNPGARDVRSSVADQIDYLWSPTVSFDARYSYSLFNFNTGTNTESHSMTLGGSYQYSPAWSASASAGAFVNRPLESKPGARTSTSVGPTFAVTLIRNFEYSSASAGVSQVVTTSAGVAGLSTTRTAFLYYDTQLTPTLTGSLSTTYSNFDTSSTNFQLLVAHAGLSWPIWKLFSVWLSYSYRWRDASQATNSLDAGVVDGNVVGIYLTASYSVWRGQL
jgi:hypothetical protein